MNKLEEATERGNHVNRTLDRISVEVSAEEFASGDFTRLQSILFEALTEYRIAVLTALRTPSEEMVAAGEAVLEDVTSVMDEDHNRRVVRNVVTAAIDSLLKGEGE